MKQPLISIIVPVYNTAPYLEKCLDSLVGQTYTNLEILCVDDESQDNSVEILQRYAARDMRVQVFSKKNEGVSLSRNFALERARGEYILFVDSDDWIEPETCEESLRLAEEHQADIIMWSYMREFGAHASAKIIFRGDQCFQGAQVQQKLQRRMIGLVGEELCAPENADALCPIWGKLYRADVIQKNQIRFYDIREIGTYEDGLFNLTVFGYARKVWFTEKYWSHYRKDNQSSITRQYKADLTDRWQRLFEIMDVYIASNNLGQEYRLALQNRICLSMIGLALNILAAPVSWYQKVQKIADLLNSERYKNAYQKLEIKWFPLHWKAFFLCCKCRFAWGVYGLACCMQKMIGR